MAFLTCRKKSAFALPSLLSIAFAMPENHGRHGVVYGKLSDCGGRSLCIPCGLRVHGCLGLSGSVLT